MSHRPGSVRAMDIKGRWRIWRKPAYLAEEAVCDGGTGNFESPEPSNSKPCSAVTHGLLISADL